MTSGRKRIVVAMSGGVDSSTVAALLASQGHEVIGVTMQLWDYGEGGDGDAGCCTLDDVRDARRVAERIGISHYVVNYMDVFKNYIVEDFINKYLSGRTPNPCVLCNQFVKFNFLLKRTLELDADYLATGHYATIERDETTGRRFLSKAADGAKDQSYFLFALTQAELSRVLFPLGGYSKAEVRALAEGFNLDVSNKPDSQEICFVTGGNYREFLKNHADINNPGGEIVDTEGTVLGRHDGIHTFTVGQRRGLGLGGGRGGEEGGKPLYVLRIDPGSNRVVVGYKDQMLSSRLVAHNLVWSSELPVPGSAIGIKAKIRHRHAESDATVTPNDDSTALVEFSEPQRALAPGQAVVFYEGRRVLGGGWIGEVLA